MHEDTQLTEALERVYGLQNTMLSRIDLHLHKERGVYEVTQTNGSQWILRVTHQEQERETLLTCAEILQLLQQHHYVAPCVVVGKDGESVGSDQGWWMLLTTWIEGNQIEYTPEHVSALGATLGQLHAVYWGEEVTTKSNRDLARWHPLQVGKEALQHLTRIAEKVPPSLQAQYETCQTTLMRTSQWEHLPAVIVHGDCHPHNALQTSSRQVVLVDWEKAGIGPAVLDIGTLLLRCHPLWLRPNIALVQAAVDGYCQHRLLTFPELDALRDALCFKVALEGAWYLIDAVESGEKQEMKRLRESYALAEKVALLARSRFEELLERGLSPSEDGRLA